MSASRRAAELVQALDLRAHPEGGHYREVFRSEHVVLREGTQRSALTTIYYLLQEAEYSRWHVVASDEAWHFYEGGRLELLTYDPESAQLRRVHLGPAAADSSPVHVVPAGSWQTARPLGGYTLAGCSVAPGFEFADFRLVAKLPERHDAFAGKLAPFQHLL